MTGIDSCQQSEQESTASRQEPKGELRGEYLPSIRRPLMILEQNNGRHKNGGGAAVGCGGVRVGAGVGAEFVAPLALPAPFDQPLRGRPL
jgi:hypothetical protein